jgi:hypothetical protein
VGIFFKSPESKEAYAKESIKRSLDEARAYAEKMLKRMDEIDERLSAPDKKEEVTQ